MGSSEDVRLARIRQLRNLGRKNLKLLLEDVLCLVNIEVIIESEGSPHTPGKFSIGIVKA